MKWTIVALLLVQAATAHAEVVRRFAVIAGANDGGRGRVRLQYAATDARAVAAVLETLGGVLPEDRALLLEPTRDQLVSGLESMRARLANARLDGRRLELIVYYSGHSDEEGLLLGGDRFAYRELRALMETLPADVRVAILDSCASGALMRRKGGTRRPPFLFDESAKVHGHAFLTSSSATEAALESDRVGGSFFTHYLLSGLRGAADVTRDGRVTLNEAYQFAFDETLARTEATEAGAQHAAYDIQLRGTGDLVMTDLRGATSGVRFPEAMVGRVYLRDRDGRLVAELAKRSGRTVELGLERGDYALLLERDGHLFETKLTLAGTHKTELSDQIFARVAAEVAVERGSRKEAEAELDELSREARARLRAPAPAPATLPAAEPEKAPADSADAPATIALLPMISTNALYGSRVRSHFALNLLMGESAELSGVELAFGLNFITERAQGVELAFAGNIVRGDLRGVQLAMGTNIVYGNTIGAQNAFVFNFTGGDLDVAQLAFGANVTVGRVRGLQSSTAFNYAGALQGAQLGAVNVTGDGAGVQIGLWNVAGKLDGVQLGLVNVAEDVDVALGLLSFIENGLLHADLWTSEAGMINADIRFGSRYFYTILTGGLGFIDDPSRWTAGGGWGVRIPFRDHFFFDADALGGVVQHGLHFSKYTTAGYGRARLMVGASIFQHLAIFAGATFNVLATFDELDARGLRFAPGYAFGEEGLRAWPGFVVGLQI